MNQPGADAIATLGSLDDIPKCKVKVRILGHTHMPGFYSCVTEHGQEIVVHKHKLELQPKP